MAKWLAVLLLTALLVAAQPPAEIFKIHIEKTYALCNATLCINPVYTAKAYINTSSAVALGAWALVKGEWKALDWCYPTGPGPCTFVIELKPEYEALGFPLWTSQRGQWVWVQSVDIYGVNAVCTMAYKCPEIDKVEVERGGELGGWRVRVYVKSPSQRMRVALDIGGVYVEKEVEQPFTTACTTLRVDFGPYDLPQGVCGRVRVYGDCGTIERQVCTPEVTTTTPCPTVTTTVTTTVTRTTTVTTTATSTTTVTSTAYVPVTTTVTITREVTSPIVVTSPTVITVPTTVTQTATERLVVKEADAALLAAVAVAALAVGVLIGRVKKV